MDIYLGRYNIWGSVPRSIFRKTEVDDEDLLRSLIVSSSLKNIMKLATNQLATSLDAGQFENVSHRVLHLHDVEKDDEYKVNYKEPIVTFASKLVAQQVYNQAIISGELPGLEPGSSACE